MTSFFRFANKWAIYRLGIVTLAHAPVHVTDFLIVNVHVDELSSARIRQYKLCATLSANVNINCHLPIKVYMYYRICTLRHIRIKTFLNLTSQSVSIILSFPQSIYRHYCFYCNGLLAGSSDQNAVRRFKQKLIWQMYLTKGLMTYDIVQHSPF